MDSFLHAPVNTDLIGFPVKIIRVPKHTNADQSRPKGRKGTRMSVGQNGLTAKPLNREGPQRFGLREVRDFQDLSQLLGTDVQLTWLKVKQVHCECVAHLVFVLPNVGNQRLKRLLPNSKIGLE